MKHFIILGMALSLAACTTSHPETPQPNTANSTDAPIADSATIVADTKAPQALDAAQFTEIDTSGVLLFPLAFPSGDEKGAAYLSKTRGSAGGYWNFVFYNSKTGISQLLTRDKTMFYDYRTTLEELDTAIHNPYIFYTGAAADYNNDKKLNGDDPTYLFVSDRTGNNFHRISPEHCSVQSWSVIRSSGLLMLTVLQDRNKDRIFDTKDEKSIYQVDLRSGQPGTEIFNQPFKNQLKVLFNQQWGGKQD